MTDAAEGGKRDFFVSFNQADRAWATWIAWLLEEKGYSIFFQDWDFKGNFVLEMDNAHARSRRTLAVLSPDYLASRFAAPEWAARFAQDATSKHDLLIPVRVRPCELEGLLAQIVYVDLVGAGEATAQDKLLKRIAGIRVKPDERPLFPGEDSHEVVPVHPAFPVAPQKSERPLVVGLVATSVARNANNLTIDLEGFEGILQAISDSIVKIGDGITHLIKLGDRGLIHYQRDGRESDSLNSMRVFFIIARIAMRQWRKVWRSTCVHASSRMKAGLTLLSKAAKPLGASSSIR